MAELILPAELAGLHWTELDDALLDVEEVLELLAPHRTAKAKPKPKTDPLSARGLAERIKNLTRALRRAVSKKEREALKAALGELQGVEWGSISAAARTSLILAAAGHMVAAGLEISPIVETVILDKFGTMARASAEAAAGPAIVPTFDAVDERVIRHAATSQAAFVRDEFGRRAEVLSRTARGIVGKGIREGLDPKTIGSDLSRILGKQGLGRSRAYWESVASIHMVRARSFGQLKGFEAAGVTRFQVVAMLDEVTTVQCRFMHGKVFDVAAGLDSYAEVAAAGPESVAEIMPFLQFGKLKDAEGNLIGDDLVYYKQGDQRIPVAEVEENAFGTKGEVGKFGKTASEAQLAAAGIQTAPFHGRCRTTIRAVV